MASISIPQSQPSKSINNLTSESIPTVDLRLLTQSELTALSLISSHAFDLRRCDDVVIPKIDRSVFNESAGSRKQTYSRLRLAPRNNINSTTNAKPSFTSSKIIESSEHAENSRIVKLFKSLFNLNNGLEVGNLGNVGDELALVPVSVTYCDDVRKSGRKANEDYSLPLVVVEEEKEKEREREKELVNKNGVVVDLIELGKKEELFVEELRRMTAGKETAKELLGFLYDLEGQWGSTRRKRKIVDANLFGDSLPIGWKVLLAIKKKQGRAWVFCRRYLSPNGRHFASCKEVSSYLLSLTGPQELKEQPIIQGPAISASDNLASKDVAEIHTKAGHPALPDTSQSSDHKNKQMNLHISPVQEDGVMLSKAIHSGEVHASSASALKCHKCSTSFSEKDELLNHLVLCHKRKRRKAGDPVEDDDLVKDGKYECQFCDKIYLERSSYFGHIGIHVKNYVRTISGTPGVTAKQKTSEPVSIGEVSMTVSATRGSPELKAGTPIIAPSSELNTNVLERMITENCSNNQNSLSEAAQNDKTLASNNTMVLDEADDSNVNPDDCFDSDKVLFEDNNDLCENSQEINDTDGASSEISKSPGLGVVNAESCLFSESNQLDLSDAGGFVKGDVTGREEILPSEFDLLTDNEKSSNQVSAYRSFVNSCFDEEEKFGDDERMMDGSGSDIDVNCDDDLKGSGSMEEFSDLPNRVEESCGLTVSMIEQTGSKVSDFNLEDVEVTTDIDRDTLERRSESGPCFPKDYVSNYIDDEEMRGSDHGMVQPTGVSAFQAEQTCSPENIAIEVLNKKGEEHTSNLFFSSRSSDNHLDATTMTDNDQSHNEVSNVLGAFSTFVEEKQMQVPKSLLSCLSMNEHSREVSMDEVGNVSSTSTKMHFPGLDKVDSSRSDKSLLDYGNMADMNERFLAAPEESSPFQLWGQQSCGLEGDQIKVYGGADGVAQLERASDNPLNLISFQQQSGGGNNLNEVCMNEQRYAQHNGDRREGISHTNALNLAGFSQQFDSGYNLNKPSINQQSYGLHQNESRAYSSCDQATQERMAYGDSLSLASVQQDTRYSLNKTCAQQTVDAGYSLNKGYIDSMQGLSKLDNLGQSRDRDLMIGFDNSSGRPNQTATTEFMWRSTEGSILTGGLEGPSSSRGQLSGSFQAFDFLSDKAGDDLYTTNEKFDNISNFDGLRSSVEPMEFSFMTNQDSNTQLEHPKNLQYNTEMDQRFGSLPNMMGGHVVSTLCVWCGNEFQQDPLACEMQAGSIGYLCPACKARMSGQFL